MADTIRMAFEGQAFYGAAGATATTELTNCRDITYELEVEKGDTTVRGTQASPAAPPIKTEKVTIRSVSIEVTMLYDSADTNLAAMLTAAFGGLAWALRTKDYASGVGFNGDVTSSVSRPFPLNGEQVITFTCTPTRDEGRDPTLHA